MTLQDKQSSFLRLKLAASTAKAGEFEGYGAVFGNVDSYGDIILPALSSKAWQSIGLRARSR